jgi:asparagine synthase (glutamine-hydrolysing)
MCGICGIWQAHTAVEEQTLRAMNDRQAHRGPDDWGLYRNPDGRLGLGFRRLAIIDLSPTGHQPMTNEDGALWIVFNGEIYNYPALRKELVGLGHEFRSTSDTEVILHGYEEWREGVLTRLHGMFAFAVWDESDQSLLLARDRLGIKPLHYYWDGKRFAFASEIKSLLTLPGVKTELDHSAIWDYFTYLYIPTPKTAYKYIRKLPPAHRLKLGADFVYDGKLAPQIQEYWDVTRWGTATLSRRDAAEALRAKLADSVQSHLIADVPVGVLLSGGLDSSAVTAFATSGLQPPTLRPRSEQASNLQTFSNGFDVVEASELQFAQTVADKFQTHHRTRVVSRTDFADARAKMVGLYDEPFADSSGLPTLAVSQLAAKHVKVVLAGDGGDETLAGYFKYLRWLELGESDRSGPAFRKFLFDDVIMRALIPLAGLPKVMGLINMGLLDMRGKEGADRFGAVINPIKPFQKARLLPDLAREFKDYDDYWYLRRYWRNDLDPLSCMQYVDIKTYLHDDILTKVDRASMAASLEVRVPLLDHEWVEFAASLPSEFRLNKAILREALQGILPDVIVSRGKKGFSAPVLEWQGAVTRDGVRLGGAALWAVQVYDEWKARCA